MTRASKQPIALREKKLKDGRRSLYLDTYIEGVRGHRYEFLRLYLVPERTKEDKAQNRQTLDIAKAIQAQRIMEQARGKAGLPRNNAKKILLHDYILSLVEKKKANGTSSDSIIMSLRILADYLLQYSGQKTTLAMIDKRYCIDFMHYLTKRKVSKGKGNLSVGSCNIYFQRFVYVLNCAVRDEIININPANLLSSEDKKVISYSGGHRDYLTEEELQLLAKTHCSKITKHAFMFACFTGLRISDIERLRWTDIVEDTQGNLVVNMMQKKTDDEIYIPLSANALAWLPAEKNSIFVFPLDDASTTSRRLKIWAERAGIKKKVTFHISRHTFATLLITHGADIYTTSKLLGHKSVATTQIYGEIIDKKKQNAVNALDVIKLSAE